MGTFKDSLKKWFYTQGTQAASASARVPLLDASGNPIGSDTMNNLASVLGAIKVQIATGSLNDYENDGVYFVNGFVENTPNNINSRAFLIVKRGTVASAAYVMQEYTEALNSANRRWIRVKDSSWSNWKEL